MFYIIRVSADTVEISRPVDSIASLLYIYESCCDLSGFYDFASSLIFKDANESFKVFSFIFVLKFLSMPPYFLL